MPHFIRLKLLFITALIFANVFLSSLTAQEIDITQLNDTEFDFKISPKFRLYDFEIMGPGWVIGPKTVEIIIRAKFPDGSMDTAGTGTEVILINDLPEQIEFKKGFAVTKIHVASSEKKEFRLQTSKQAQIWKFTYIPSWLIYVLGLGFLVLTVLFYVGKIARKAPKNGPVAKT